MQDNEINSYSNNFLEKKAKEINDKIMGLQFVDDCLSRKKLICEVEQKCGYLCQIHFLIVCHIQAYYQNRTVIFKDLDPLNLLKPNVKYKLGGHLDIIPNLNRFSESYLPFSNCNITGKEKFRAVNIHRGILFFFLAARWILCLIFVNPLEGNVEKNRNFHYIL